MTEKSDLWDINTTAKVTFTRVFFGEEVTKEEAIRRFLAGEVIEYIEADTDPECVTEILSARAY